MLKEFNNFLKAEVDKIRSLPRKSYSRYIKVFNYKRRVPADTRDLRRKYERFIPEIGGRSRSPKKRLVQTG
jgi:hypothetical protein